MSIPSVAVLVAAYNAAATLPRCLDSLCGQTMSNLEIICVDDCSTDVTLEILHERANKDTRIKVLQTPRNSGQAVARNLALQHVQASFICMVDADDWLSLDALEKAMDCFRQHPRTDCVMFQLIIHDDTDDHEEDYGLPDKLVKGEALSGNEAFELCIDGWKLHGLYLTRRSLYQAIPFDTSTRLYSDDNTSCLHYLHSREVRACTGTYFYRRHLQSLTTSFSPLRFDQMEAMLSLLFQLKKEAVQSAILRRYESHRWMAYIHCYRLFLQHRAELDAQTILQISARLRTILHTFRPSRLPLRSRWKPGYWLMLNTRLFHFQQQAYLHLWVNGLKKSFKIFPFFY